jgi:hypothetical protein
MTTENPTTLEDASRALRAGVIAMLRNPSKTRSSACGVLRLRALSNTVS